MSLLRALRFLLPVLLPALVVAGCGEPQRPSPQLKREPLRLTVDRTGRRLTASVEPRFRPFAELAGGIVVKPRNTVRRTEEERTGDPLFYPEKEVNNVPEKATEVELPAICSGYLHPLPDSPDGDADWYSFLVDLDRPGLMAVELTGVPRLDLVLDIYYDSVKGRTRLVTVDNQGPGKGESLPNFNLVNGRYYLRINQRVAEGKKPRFDVVHAYQVTLQFKETSATEETEPNDKAVSAVPIMLDQKMSGLVNRKGDEDWYLVDLQSQGINASLAVELLPPMGTDMALAVETQTRQELLSATTAEGQRLLIPNIAVLQSSRGYYLRVTHTGRKVPKEAYSLTVRYQAREERIEMEPNDAGEAALQLYWEEPLAGWLSHEGDVDWFLLEPNFDWGTDEETGRPETPALQVVLGEAPGIDLVLELFDNDRETLLGRFDNHGKGEGEKVPNLAVPERRLYLKVSSKKGYNASAQYLLQAQAVTTDGWEVEANNTLATATAVADVPDQVMGYLVPRGDRDCLKFTTPGLRFQVDPPPDAAMTISAYTVDEMLFFQETARDGSVSIKPQQAGVILCLQEEGGGDRTPDKPYVIRASQETLPTQ